MFYNAKIKDNRAKINAIVQCMISIRGLLGQYNSNTLGQKRTTICKDGN